MSGEERTQEDDGTQATRREGHGPERAQLPKPEHLPRGTAVGRYLVLDVLGEGGMGVVYAAFDPELDRKVAVKLLQARAAAGSSGGDQAWLLREAQAMARLSHPNVLAVHDVGTLSGDRVFVAMELVEGATLRSWLEREVRPWQLVLSVMRAAGAGLAAAHAAGLVHRDFKPDNVLVGKDGRVRVMDFGLARLRSEEGAPARPSDMTIEKRSPLSEDLTVAGTLVGTPAYMAPEIHDGRGADARSDQFAFGVALYEALYRVRPFDKAALVPPRAAGLKPRDPPDSSVPARVLRVVRRAIAIDPEARFPSIDALLAELDADAADPRRRLAMVGGGFGAIGIALAVFVASRGTDDRVKPCTGTERHLAGVWDDSTRRAVHTAFDATKRPFAAAAFTGIERALDGYAAEWTVASTESCEATKVRGEQPPEVLALRQSCLDDRLEELHALTALLAHADAALVERGDKSVWALEPIKSCANVAALLGATQPPPEQRTKIDAIRTQLADARAQLAAGKLDVATATATAASAAAAGVTDEPLRAETLLIRATVMLRLQKPADAMPLLADAAWTAMRSKRDDLVAQAALASALATASSHPDEAKLWLALGEASAARVGITRILEQDRLEIAGIVAAERGDLATAVDDHTKALAAAELALGHDSPALWRSEQALAATLAKSSAWVKAIPHFERALAQRTASVGEAHPDVALILSNLGACYSHAGDPAKARTAFERALAIREQTFGKTSPQLIVTLNNIADFLRREGDFAAALANAERGKAIAAAVPGTAHPLYHTVATTYGEVLLAAGRLADARVALDEVIALELAASSPLRPTTETSRAEVSLAEHAWADALVHADLARSLVEASGGKDAADLVRPLTDAALAKLQLHDRVTARGLLERALAIGAKTQVDDAELAPARAALATLGPP